MHVLRAPGLRVIANPAALDGAVWHDGRDVDDDFDPLVLRFAPDDAFAIGAVHVDVDDPDAIIEREAGFSAVMLGAHEFEERVAGHLEWSLPPERPALAQGAVAGVPAKLLIDPTGAATIVVATAYLDELEWRLR